MLKESAYSTIQYDLYLVYILNVNCLHASHKQIIFKIYLTVLYKKMCSLAIKHFKLYVTTT